MTRRLIVALAAVAMAAAGCGGGGDDGKDTYVKEFNKADVTLERTLTGIGEDIQARTSGRAVGAKLDEGARALDDAAQDFEAIDPPTDADAAHRKIVAGLRKLAALFRDSATAAREDDVARLTRTLQGLQSSPGAREIRAAQQELKAKGYKVKDG
jgi:predicted small secreted protein